MAGKFVLSKGATGKFHFVLKAGNGEVILRSETYTARASAVNGIESVRKNAPIAALEDQTAEGFAEEKNPKFEVYADKAGEFRVRFKYNSEIIFSTEGYSDRSGAKRAIESIKKHVGEAETVDID